MAHARHHTFEQAALAPVVAHGEQGAVLAARVLEGAPLAFVDLVVVPVGAAIGRHEHGADEEVYVVVSGTGEMVVDGSRFGVGPGHVVVNRPGGTHELANTGAEPLRLVVVDVGLPEA